MSLLSPRTFRLFALFSLLALHTGCASHQAPQKSMLWHSRDQFVALVERDDQGVKQAPNQHPASISAKNLREELAALKVRLPGGAKPVRLFDDPEVKILVAQIPAALQNARPDQDLVFAIYGRNPLLKGFASEEVITTGRAFYRDNSLNLILGMVRETIRETDRRLQPFVPASRATAAPMPGAVTSASGKLASAAQRPDWLIIPVPEGATEEVAVPEPEQVAPQAAPAAKTAPPPAAMGIEERLRTLAELKAKGLITEEEYRAKKESILKEL